MVLGPNNEGHLLLLQVADHLHKRKESILLQRMYATLRVDIDIRIAELSCLKPVTQLQALHTLLAALHILMHPHANAAGTVGEHGDDLLNVLGAWKVGGEDEANLAATHTP